MSGRPQRKPSAEAVSLARLALDKSTDPIDKLRALQVRVGEALDGTSSARDVAALARQYTQLTLELAEAEAGDDG